MAYKCLKAMRKQIIKVLDRVLCIVLNFIHSLENGIRKAGCKDIQKVSSHLAGHFKGL
jgi:hypothetical protein